jgi:regulator of protease activity HflC (stomatin/prohibitin superfamily)
MFGFTPLVTAFALVLLLILSGIKILREYERGVIFRLGRLVLHRGPGICVPSPWMFRLKT